MWQMNTKILMAGSAAFLGVSGVLLEFFPHEVLAYAGVMPTGFAPVVLQMLGAAYFGLAMTNWMAKSVLIGGIYARPLAIGNLAHFLIAALALVKYAATAGTSPAVCAVAAVYSAFAVLFGIVLFTHPASSGKQA